MTSKQSDKISSILSLSESNPSDEIKGKFIKITSTTNNSYQGIVVSYIPHQMILLQTSPDSSLNASRSTNLSGAYGLQVVNVNSVKHVSLETSLSENVPQLIHPVNDIPYEYLKKREDSAIRVEMETSARLGVGVTKVAQNIFDALSKTLPASWSGKSIVVMDEIKIDPPYTPASTVILSGKSGAEISLNRVKKVLEGERLRLGLK